MAVLSRLGIVFSLLFVLVAPTLAAAELRVIPLKHRSASELVPVVRPLVGEGGSVTAFGQQLIIRAEPQELAAVEELLGRLDRKRQTLRILVRQEVSRGQTDSQVGVSGRVSAGEVRIEAGPQAFGRKGSSIGAGHGGGLRARYSRRLGNLRQSTQQFLQVLDGERALLTVGQEVPFTRQLALLAGRHEGLAETVDFREVSTGFRVRPHLQGEEVRLEITPQMASLDPRHPGVIEFQSLTTTMLVPLREWYNLAGHLRYSDEVSRAILSWRVGEGSEERSIWVKVEK